VGRIKDSFEAMGQIGRNLNRKPGRVSEKPFWLRPRMADPGGAVPENMGNLRLVTGVPSIIEGRRGVVSSAKALGKKGGKRTTRTIGKRNRGKLGGGKPYVSEPKKTSLNGRGESKKLRGVN